MIFLTCPIVCANALSDFEPEEIVGDTFEDYYKHKEHGIEPSRTEGFIFYDCKKTIWHSSRNRYFDLRYALVKFISPNARNIPYYNRFGANEEYFEYSDVTNWQFKSGMAVFLGDVFGNITEYNTLLTLEELAESAPDVFDKMSCECDDFYKIYQEGGYGFTVDNRFFGRVGDADGDCTVSISDVTEIQKHLVGLTTLEKTRLKAAEIDNQEVSIDTATQIQLYLAGFTDKIEAPHTEEILVN